MTSSSWKLRLADFIATGFYSGRFPLAPGTVGSAVMVLITIFAYWISDDFSDPLVQTLVLVTVTAAGIYTSNLVLESGIYGADTTDPKQIVIDEFAGIVVSIFGLGVSPTALILGFAAFRLFDVTKPPPIKFLEKFPRGYGIMLDDLWAGVYANIAVRCLMYFWRSA